MEYGRHCTCRTWSDPAIPLPLNVLHYFNDMDRTVALLLILCFRYNDPIAAMEWWDEHACCSGRWEVYCLVLPECNLYRQRPPSKNDFWERSQVHISVILFKRIDVDRFYYNYPKISKNVGKSQKIRIHRNSVQFNLANHVPFVCEAVVCLQWVSACSWGLKV